METCEWKPIANSYGCQRCGRVDCLDAVIPNKDWAVITEGKLNEGGETTDGKWNILCLWCIDALCQKHNIQSIVILHYAGNNVYGTSENEDTRNFIGKLWNRIKILEQITKLHTDYMGLQ